MAKITREKFKTFENVFDNFTNTNLVSLAKRGYFAEGTLSPIKIGKEANIFSAKTEEGKKICLKIYRLETANFNKMYKYIRSDPRFIGLKNKHRRIIFAWVQREFKNLTITHREAIPVPKPIKFFSNILLMSFIGDDQPAPMLKDAPPKDSKKFFNKLIKSMAKLCELGLVHGDLSKFNILNWNETPVLIDFSHGTNKNNPIYLELLERDAKNIAEDFKGYGIKTSQEEILKKIKKKLHCR